MNRNRNLLRNGNCGGYSNNEVPIFIIYNLVNLINLISLYLKKFISIKITVV